MPNTSKAAEAYSESRKRVDGLLDQIKTMLETHAGRHRANPYYWGFVSELNQYADELREILHHFEFHTKMEGMKAKHHSDKQPRGAGAAAKRKK